jgi:3-(3-hydroxy-phenyl)propionate hydroxylase
VGAAPDVIVVGAGPVGAALALELARRDLRVLVLDAKPHYVAEGSKAMVLARHAFEILADVGCPELVRKAIVLERARTYFRDVELFSVEFPPPPSGETPLFGNLQQTHVERALLRRAEETGVEVRWGARLVGLEEDERAVTVRLDDDEELRTRWLVGCDGASSTVRKLLGVEFAGRSFDDRFLITDVRVDLGLPNERRFWFDPPWNPRRQVLIHPEPDGEWRIDWQVPPETDLDEEWCSGRLDERVRRIVGEREYEIVWATLYRFHERVAARFRAGRVLLAGDAAHLVAPFGARGLNSGLEDACNLGWRLALVHTGEAVDALLDGYERERRAAAVENVRVTSRTMRFMAPPTRMRKLLRNATLRGSVHSRRLRGRVDSGKLAVPAVYATDRGPVGRPCPRDVALASTRFGFSVGELDGVRVLVRPDGYVCAVLGPRPVEEALRAELQQAAAKAPSQPSHR